jgi:DNA-binding protein HU-beta
MELVSEVAVKAGLTTKEAEKVVVAVLESIKEALVGGDKAQLMGFGTFAIRNRSARTGRNPRSGETIEIPASKAVGFSAGKAFKDAVS